MSSHAFRQFKRNMIDVWRLMDAHRQLKTDSSGRQKLGHITRSGILMLCACWELYSENVLIESSKYLSEKNNDPKGLPKDVQKNLSKIVKSAKHELKPLELAGDGWKTVYMDYCMHECRSLNTPKTENLKGLYKRYIGLNDISSIWSSDAKDIDDFVSHRGHIAHNGRTSKYVHAWQLRNYSDMIYGNSVHMDNELCRYLLSKVGTNVQPWRKTAK